MRDIPFYIFSALMTLILAIYGKINILISVLMLCLYLLLVIVVFIQDKCYPDKPEVDEKELIEIQIN